MEKNKLLIVDDDMSNLIELTHILQPEYKIYTAKDGASAFEIAKKISPDLILLDIIMPGMSGFDVIAELKKDEITKNIRVIFITGINETNNESEGLAKGAVDYIRKPFDRAVVILRVRHQMQIINLKREMEFAARTAEMANRAKSVFLANMSHEIRTPMNAILGVTEILLHKETLPTEIEEGLNKIYSSCDMLLGIINDILDFSKIEAGKLDIMPGQYKVAHLVNDALHLNMMRIESKPIEFELQIDGNIPEKLIGDELRIKQIFNNLLSNAFKYTNSGTVTLSVHTKPYISLNSGKPEKGLILLVISVCDTGFGMTKDQLNKMFDEYSRFHNKNSKTIEGTGLGLAITHTLVTLMNGDINVVSEPGKGSLFTVSLPQRTVDSAVLGKEAASELINFRDNYMKQTRRVQIVRDPMPYGSILIVDDVETNLHVAVSLMKLYRLKIDTAMDGYKAIEYVKKGKVYDIIFMDHMMPEMDGIEAAKKIRDLGYNDPIVALTANAVAGQADIFLHNGFNDFISKPIDIRQLDIVLNKYIRDKQPQEVIEEARKNIEHIHAESRESNSDQSAERQINTLLLESFIKDARKAVSWLEEQNGAQSILNDEKKLRKFTVIVHGIKSSLWNINKKELSELAFNLETGGRELSGEQDNDSGERNINLITAALPYFIFQLRDLIKTLEIKLNEKNENQKSCGEDSETLKEKFITIREKAADYDRKGVLDIIAELKNCSEETKAILESIKDHVFHSEFEEAEIIAAKYTR